MALTGGVLPLQVILARMRGELLDGKPVTDEQLAAAAIAAPYIHPRLASSDTTIKSDNVHRVVSDTPIDAEEWTIKYAGGAFPVEVPSDDAS